MKDKTSTQTRIDTGTLGKAMKLVNLIGSAQDPLRFSDLLKLTGQPRGTLHRQLSHLLEENLISLNPDTQTYELGLTFLQLAAHSWSRSSLRQLAQPFLHDLHLRTGETVHLAVLRQTQVVYLDKVESASAVRMHSQIGKTSPAYCTGVGKAMMAQLNDEQLQRLLPDINWQGFTDFTLVDASAFMEEIQHIRQVGYAEDREEHEVGIRCVAAALKGADGKLRGGISVTVPVYRLQPQQLEQWYQWVPETANNINQHLMIKLGPHA